jgi:competence protein ComEC
MKIPNWIILLIFSLVVLDAFVWFQVFAAAPNRSAEIYALDVGQGDSELVILPGNVKILIDGGPDNKILSNLSSIFPATDRYIDLVILSHPETDHFTGLIDVFKRYKVGAFISNGRIGKAKSFSDLIKAVDENGALSAVLAEGDKINYADNKLNILSPSENLLQSKETNDTTLVVKLDGKNIKALFTGDIDSKIEEELAKKYDLDVDILKVAHHGSKFSASQKFMEATTPKIALIEVGKNNYGHPTQQALNALASVGAQIFRTDKDGMIKLISRDSRIDIFKKK